MTGREAPDISCHLCSSNKSHMLYYILIESPQGWPGGCYPLHFTDEETEAQRHVFKAMQPVRGLKTAFENRAFWLLSLGWLIGLQRWPRAPKTRWLGTSGRWLEEGGFILSRMSLSRALCLFCTTVKASGLLSGVRGPAEGCVSGAMWLPGQCLGLWSPQLLGPQKELLPLA